MDKDRLRAMLDEKRPFIIGMTRFSDPRFAALMAECGYDAVCIDDEHYPFTERQMAAIIRAVHGKGAACLLRTSSNTHDEVYRALDMGLDGIYSPHISSRAEAEVIISAAKYPPRGTRGCCPITAGMDYGFSPDYECANKRTAVFLMIETKSGYDNLDDILSLSGIDVIAMGPSDFSASYGRPGRSGDPDIKAAMEDVYAKSRAKGIICENFISAPADVPTGISRGDVCLYCDSDQQLWQKTLRLKLRNACRKRSVMECLEKGEVPNLVILTSTDPAPAETAVLEGCDAVLFDYSVGSFDSGRFSMLARTVHGRGSECFIILDISAIDCVDYLLRIGADGVIVRGISSDEEFNSLPRSGRLILAMASDASSVIASDLSLKGNVNIIGNDLDLMREGFCEYLSLIRAGIR